MSVSSGMLCAAPQTCLERRSTSECPDAWPQPLAPGVRAQPPTASLRVTCEYRAPVGHLVLAVRCESSGVWAGASGLTMQCLRCLTTALAAP